MAKHQLTLTQEEREAEEQKQAVMAYMSGKEGLEVFTRELKAKGVELPESSVWAYANKRQIEAAVHATFSLLGGVPGMALWAHKNPTPFYTAYMKLAPVESNLAVGNIVIQTNVPDSPLDAVEIDSFGRVKE